MKKNVIQLLSMLSKYALIGIFAQCIFYTLVAAGRSDAQQVHSVYDVELNVERSNVSVQELLHFIEAKTDYVFAYDKKDIQKNNRIVLPNRTEKVSDLLLMISKEAHCSFKQINNNIFIKKLSNQQEAGNKIEVVLQTRTITGKVTSSEDQSGLPGANVIVKGTSQGTVTDVNGNYKIDVPSDESVLVFSSVGYQKEEVLIGNKTVVDMTLSPDIKSLQEIVVVGYGTQKKSDLTGSVSQVKSEEINAYPATNMIQALSGRVAGVQVLQTTGAPGAGLNVRIRGTNSIQGGNEPLYVVDGFPYSGNPTNINNSDIESIEVLKDASATAIYGSRGANGVVLITTKKGKSGQNIIEFESSYSSQSLVKKLDFMNASEYGTLYNTKAMNDGVAPYFTESEINNFGKGFDWQDFIYQTAPILTTSLNISGGNEKTQFSVAGSIFNQDGIIKGSTYDRYSVRLNLDHQFSNKFSLVLSSIFTRLDTDRKDSGGGSRGNSLISAQAAPPTLSPYNDDGSYTVLSTAYSFIAPDIINPINFINEQSNSIKANIALINSALVYKPIQDVTIRISAGIENRDDRSDSYTTRNFLYSEGKASVGTSQYTSLLNENTISYNKNFNDKHNVSAVAGFTYQNFLNTSLSGSGTGFLSDAFETYNLSAASTPGIPGSGYTKSALLSYLGRINYNFKNRYFATASYRADGASKFSEGNKWGYFPSAALAWRVSEEDFLKNNNLISNLKLRTTWGTTGSQAINPYVTLNQLYSGKTVFNDALYNTFSPGNQLPGDLKWETTEQIDIGIDLGIKNDRISFTADYYVKNTKDLLNTVNLPYSLGFTSTIRNVGKVQNKGIELGTDAQIFTGKFKWDMNANISFNRNKVVKLYNDADILGGNVGVVALSDVTNILREGRPIGQFWGYVEDGYDENGKIKYKDLVPDGKLTSDDKAYIGDPNPNFIYGLNSNMSYKSFELNIFLQGSYGNDLFNLSAVSYAYDYVSGMNMFKDVLENSWTPTNTDAKYPIIKRNTSVNFSNRFIEDGSFLRFKNIKFSYNFPVQKFEMNKIFQSLQIYISGQNLLTITKYSGSDPEVNDGFGIDNKSYPISKSITFGVRARF